MNIDGKRIIVSVISDLVTDQRVDKICRYLNSRGARVMLIGRQFAESSSIGTRNYAITRIKCQFRKGVFQYLEFNLKLFFKLWNYKADLFVSNDLDTLLPNYLHSKLRSKPLVYDSHEYFTGVPELREKPLKLKIWRSLESFLLPRIKHAYTVNNSVSNRYLKEFGITMRVIRNLPEWKQPSPCPESFNLPKDKTILLMQGSGINPERGYEEAIGAMQLLNDQYLLVIIGSGTIWQELKILTGKLQLSAKVMFIDKVPFEVLSCYTRQAALGLSLDKPLSENYLLSLPNKVFDYIHAGIPVLGSDIAEVKHILTRYDVGWITPDVTPEAIASEIKKIFADNDQYSRFKNNTIIAAKELQWKNEEKILDEVYGRIEF